MVILCGSSLSFMLEDVFPYACPMYGRFTDQIRVNPFQFHEILELFKNSLSSHELFEYYAITGGNPGHVDLIDVNLELKDNFLVMLSQMIKDKPEFLLKQEVKDAEKYNRIIRAIANGKTRINEIADFIHSDMEKTETMLERIERLRIVRLERPCHPVNGVDDLYKNPLVSLRDHYFRFWYACIKKNLDLVENESIEKLVSLILKQLPSYMGHAFEDICLQFALRQDDFPYSDNMGRWWGKNSKTGGQDEIDLVVADKYESFALFCECKYRNKMTSKEVIDDLKRKADMFDYPEGFRKQVAAFSANGFTQDCLSAHPDVLFLDADAICGKKEMMETGPSM